MAEPYELQLLLWDIRHDPELARRAAQDPAAVAARYDLEPAQREAFVARDFPRLLELGASPLLVYFAALDLGTSRDAYLAALRAPAGGAL